MAKRKIVRTYTAAKQRREILKYWTERNKRKKMKIGRWGILYSVE